MPYIETDSSFHMYYTSSGAGMPIVFIHPPHMGHHVFKYQNDLSNQFRIITYDIRGHGNSGKNGDHPTIQQLADDLQLLLDRLGIEQAVIVGYSAGSSIAQEFALNHPGRIKALVLSGGFPEVSTFLLRNQFQLGLALLKGGYNNFLCKHLAKSHQVQEKDQTLLYQECIKADVQTSLSYYENSMNYNCTNLLNLMDFPVLTLYGQFSHIRPYLKIYQRYLPHMKSVMISRSFHQLPIRNHFSFNHALSTYIHEMKV
ncbi:alpha/beta hydrolase [Halobacillus sp. K22]|uniref:alpha/beta hydrolase n=1 Tax=Halobacillus sp. K22 TaxID=3457431 RepID=UPI003FCEA7B5